MGEEKYYIRTLICDAPGCINTIIQRGHHVENKQRDAIKEFQEEGWTRIRNSKQGALIPVFLWYCPRCTKEVHNSA